MIGKDCVIIKKENFTVITKGIIDNKAYKKGYSILGKYRRVMEMEYIPHYKKYGNTDKNLAW